MAKTKSKKISSKAIRLPGIIIALISLLAIGYYSYNQFSSKSGINEVKTPYASVDVKDTKSSNTITVPKIPTSQKNTTTTKTTPSNTESIKAPTKTAPNPVTKIPAVKNVIPKKSK